MFRFETSGFGTFDACKRVVPSCWDRFDIFHVREGLVHLTIGGAAVDLPAGSGVIIFPHTPFEGDSVTPRSWVAVQHFAIEAGVRAADLPLIARRIGRKSRGHLLYHAQKNEDLSRDIVRLIESRPAATTTPTDLADLHTRREALLTLVLGQIDRCTAAGTDAPPVPDRFENFLAWLAQQTHRSVSLGEMAQRMEMSASHFRAEFRKRMGVSPGRHFRDLRLHAAARRLRQTGEPIKAIARALGFSDLPNFYRMFRTAYGVSPAVYRQRNAVRG